MKIILRTCEDLNPTNGFRTPWCQQKEFKLKCFESLVSSIASNDVDLFIVGDRLTEKTMASYKSLFPSLLLINYTEKLGNQQSLLKVFELADTFTDDDDIIYFCEDDYLYANNFYANALEFFKTTASQFENVFFHPTDYPDQYTDTRMRRNYIFKSELGWYREVDSTTFTFACTIKTYRKFRDLLRDCSLRKKVGYGRNKQPIFHPTGADDGRLSEIFGHKNVYGHTTFHQTALCFSPLPGTASHMHTGTESLHFNWKDLYDSIKL
jgi:hypothetical protein